MDRPLALFYRYFWESKNISWIYTDQIDRLLLSRQAYYGQYGQLPPSLEAKPQREIDDLLVSAALASESQVDKDMWGWTIRIPMKPWGLFCGVDPEGSVCGHFSMLAPEAAEDPVGAFVVQRVLAGSPVRQTSLIPRDVLARYLVEQYFDESEQVPARIAIIGNEAVMALSSPDADWQSVESLKEPELLALFHKLRQQPETKEAELTVDVNLSDAARRIKQQFAAMKGQVAGSMVGELKFMHEAVYYYGCRCSLEQMRQMVGRLPEAHQKELWQDSDSLEVECPRCGIKHTITRSYSNDK